MSILWLAQSLKFKSESNQKLANLFHVWVMLNFNNQEIKYQNDGKNWEKIWKHNSLKQVITLISVGKMFKLINTEMQINTTLRHYFSLNRVTEIERYDNRHFWWDLEIKWKIIYCLWAYTWAQHFLKEIW